MANSFRFFYDYFSPLSRSLLILFERNKIQCEKVLVALRKGENSSEEFGRNINRFHKVPVIHDNDGFKLAETIAIYHYLGRKKVIPERWYPNDVRKLAKIDEFLQWNHNSLLASTANIFYDAWVKPFRDIDTLEHNMMINVKDPLSFVDINSSLDLLEHVWLKDGKFLCGDEPTFAELISSSALMQIVGLRLYRLNEEKYKNVNKWLNETREYFNPEFDFAHQYIYKYGEKFKGKSPIEFM